MSENQSVDSLDRMIRTILVVDIPRDYDEETLLMCLEGKRNGGVDVKKLDYDQQRGRAYVTFKETVADVILQSKSVLLLKSTIVRVLPDDRAESDIPDCGKPGPCFKDDSDEAEPCSEQDLDPVVGDEVSYEIYRPYYTVIDNSANYAIEKILVNERDLNMVVQKVRIKQSFKTLAFVGELDEILQNVSRVIGEKVALPAVDCQIKPEINTIFVVIKAEWIIYFLSLSDKFLHQSGFNTEHVVVTLFRFLQDFSANILLCPDASTKSSFYSGPQNPFFSGQGHDQQVFKIESPVHTDVKFCKLDTNVSDLEHDLESKFFTNCVLNENGSKYFLHVKYADRDKWDIAKQKDALPRLLPLLLRSTWKNEHSELKSHFDSLSLESNDKLFCSVSDLHKKFVDAMQITRKYFQSALYLAINNVANELRAKKSWNLNRTCKYDVPRSQDLSESINAMASVISLRALDAKINKFVYGKKIAIGDSLKQLFHHYVQRVAEMFADILKGASDPKDVIIDVQNIMKMYVKNLVKSHFYSSFKEHLSLKSKLGERLRSLRDDVTKCFCTYFEELELNGELRLTPCFINVVQNNNGTYQNICYTRVNFQVKIVPEQIVQWFPDAREVYGTDAGRMLQEVVVTASFPLNNDGAFLAILAVNNVPSHQMLVTISGCGVQKVTVLKCQILVMAASEKNSISLYILHNETKQIHVMKFEDMKLKNAYMLLSLENLKKPIVSATLLPNNQMLLMLDNSGCLFECSLRSKGIRKLEKQQNLGNEVPKSSLLLSQNRRNYCEVYSLTNENFFILKNDKEIDVYDFNLLLICNFTIDRNNFRGIKVFADQVNVYLSVVQTGSIDSYICFGLGSDAELKLLEDNKKDSAIGNPIIDIIYASNLKFGPNAHFIGAPEKNSFYFLHDDHDKQINVKLQSYLETIPIKVEALTLRKFLSRKHMNIINRSKSYIDFIMLSRVPVQIATIESNNLIPLIDGIRQSVNHLSSTSSLAETADFLSFGHIEQLFEQQYTSAKEIRVVSIVGKQSSGKSYLLNRVFGTRFSVAATRCTDGIWLSYSRLVFKNNDDVTFRDFLILDCEGLFSVCRNELEETKLLTVLAGISDVTILNQDLNFSRHTTKLFGNLNNAMSRVKGTRYFKGFLMIAVRDVMTVENHQPTLEFQRNIVELNKHGDHHFLTKLFNRVLVFQSFNHFSIADTFSQEIAKLRMQLFEFDVAKFGIEPKHWTNIRDCIDHLKILLLQLYSDDSQSSDEHFVNVKLISIERQVLSAWGQINNVGDRALQLKNYTVSFGDNREFEIKHSQNEFTFDSASDDGYNYLVSKLREKFDAIVMKNIKMNTSTFNMALIGFNKFFCEVISDRVNCVNYFLQKLVEALDKRFGEDDKKKVTVIIQKKVNAITGNYSVCLEPCHQCNLKCVGRKGHKDANLAAKFTIQIQIEEKKKTLEAFKVDRAIAENENYQSKQSEMRAHLHNLELEKLQLQQQLKDSQKHKELCEHFLSLNASISNITEQLNIEKQQLTELPNNDKEFEENLATYPLLIDETCKYLRKEVAQHSEVTSSVMSALESLLVNNLLAFTDLLSETELSYLHVLLSNIDTNFMSASIQKIMDMMHVTAKNMTLKAEEIRKYLQMQLAASNKVLCSTNSAKSAIASKLHIFSKRNLEEDIQRLKNDIKNNRNDLTLMLDEQQLMSDRANECKKEQLAIQCQLAEMSSKFETMRSTIFNMREREMRYQIVYGNMDDMKAMELEQQSSFLDAKTKYFVMCFVHYLHLLRLPSTVDDEKLRVVVAISNSTIIPGSKAAVDMRSSKSMITVREHLDTTVGSYCDKAASAENQSKNAFDLCASLEHQREECVKQRQTLEGEIAAFSHISASYVEGRDRGSNDSDTIQEKVRKKQALIQMLSFDIDQIAMTIAALTNGAVNSAIVMLRSELEQEFDSLFNSESIQSRATGMIDLETQQCKIKLEIDDSARLDHRVIDLETQLGIFCKEKLMLEQKDLENKYAELNTFKTTKIEEMSRYITAKNIKANNLEKWPEEDVKTELMQIESMIQSLQNEIIDLDANITSTTALQKENKARLTKLTENPNVHQEMLDEFDKTKMLVEASRTALYERMNKIEIICGHRIQFHSELVDAVRIAIEEHALLEAPNPNAVIGQLSDDVYCREMLNSEIQRWTTDYYELEVEIDRLKLHIASTSTQYIQLEKAAKTLTENYNSMKNSLRSQEDKLISVQEQLNTSESITSTLLKTNSVLAGIKTAFEPVTFKLESLICLAKMQEEYYHCMQIIQELNEKHSTASSIFSQVSSEKLNLEMKDIKPVECLTKKLDENSVQLEDCAIYLQELENFATLNQDYLEKKTELNDLEMSLYCSCQTDHCCDKQCGICDDKRPCKHPAGHGIALVGAAGDNEIHICNKKQHDCPFLCAVTSLCKNKCMYEINHIDPSSHTCHSNHECSECCKYCFNKCSQGQIVEHSLHICSEQRCPAKCMLCENGCIGPHNHNDQLPLRQITCNVSNAEQTDKFHLCDNEHPCLHECDAEGVCEVHYERETRTHTNAVCTQDYIFIKPKSRRKLCKILLAKGQTTHAQTHNCGGEHKCDSKCVECGSFCQKNIDHEGEHSTTTHRNKEYCFCVTKTEGAQVTIEDDKGIEGGKTLRTYKAGNSFVLETCEQQCRRKGRAHFHLVPCPGGENCGEQKHDGGVKHCLETERFYPFHDKVYDKYLCRQFWLYHNWSMPADDEDMHLCNYICPSKLHDETEETPSFCSLPAWHCHSDLAKDHSFQCHDLSKIGAFSGIDICFCIDTSGSMSKHIKQCMVGIKKIMSDTIEKLKDQKLPSTAIRFSAVGYKNHKCDPVVQKLDFTDDMTAIHFLDTIQARSAGLFTPEAVLDGLDAADSMSWEETSMKIIFHILDAPPHGRKFGSFVDPHKEGCPCGKQESIILTNLRNKDIAYYVVPLSSNIEMMMRVFGQHINLVKKSISQTLDLSTLISQTVCEIIEDRELSAVN